MLIGKSVDSSLRSGALKGSREIGCELEGHEVSEEACRRVGQVLMAQKTKVIAKEMK